MGGNLPTARGPPKGAGRCYGGGVKKDNRSEKSASVREKEKKDRRGKEKTRINRSANMVPLKILNQLRRRQR